MLIDLSARTKIRLAGADRERYLNGQLTNELAAARLGRTVHGCFLTAKGKLVADVFVTITRDDSLIVDSAAELREPLLTRLEKYLVADEVVLTDETENLALFHVLDLEVTPATLPEGTVSESDRYACPGFDLLLPAALRHLVPSLFKQEPVSDDVTERLRIQRGVPAWGHEMSGDVLPPEVGLDRDAISYTKGCYVGQEVISRIKSVGHVNRQLVGLRLAEGPGLTPGDGLIDDEGKAIGKATSACFDPEEKRWIGLGIVRREFAQPGQKYRVQLAATPGSTGWVEIAILPFTE